MTPHMPTGTTTRRILRMALARGGLTINPYTGEEPDTGYVVGCHKDHEVWSTSTAQLDASTLHEYIRANADLLSNGEHLGIWLDKGETWLDVVKVVDDLPIALVLAKEHNQQAIYDLENREVIWMKEKDAS